MTVMKEIKKGDWIEVKIGGYVEECKVKEFNERGIDVWDGVEEEWHIAWKEINSVKLLVEGLEFSVMKKLKKEEVVELVEECNNRLRELKKLLTHNFLDDEGGRLVKSYLAKKIHCTEKG